MLRPRRAPCHIALLAHLTPIRRRVKTRPALLHRTVASEDARVARPIREPFSRFSAGNASLPGRPLSPHNFCASVARGGGF